ncbi:sensor histidine kinase [Micromonospora sp. KLBMP9576]|uniref:sensor histidine kinase n=1 Tax=Micromonospora sp. KLBMP9576 TaxID=3424769 RepID=UPI003D8DD07C
MPRCTEPTGEASPAQAVARVVEAVHGLPGTALPGAQAATLARALGECLDAESVTLCLRLPLPPTGDPDATATRDRVRRYHWGRPDRAGPDRPGGDERRAAPDDDRATAGRSDPDTGLGDDQRFLADVSVQPAVAGERLHRWPELRTVVRLLLADIQAQLRAAEAGKLVGRSATRLADARSRAAGEIERQRFQLERDLHDGAQPHLVALQMSLAVVEHQLGVGRTAEAAHHLDRLRQLLASTEEVLHTTATGLLALPLADHGLVAALTARLGALETIVLDVDPLLAGRRYPPEVEATVYLACLEAISNAHKHAPGAEVTLTLRSSAAGLGFEVADTGPGFDTGGRMPLHHLAARLAAVGGTLSVRSSPGEGTRVTGFVTI